MASQLQPEENNEFRQPMPISSSFHVAAKQDSIKSEDATHMAAIPLNIPSDKRRKE